MKKRVVKKIVLTKETLRSLSNSATRVVAGGGTLTGGDGSCNISCATYVSCETCRVTCRSACVTDFAC